MGFVVLVLWSIYHWLHTELEQVILGSIGNFHKTSGNF